MYVPRDPPLVLHLPTSWMHILSFTDYIVAKRKTTLTFDKSGHFLDTAVVCYVLTIQSKLDKFAVLFIDKSVTTFIRYTSQNIQGKG